MNEDKTLREINKRRVVRRYPVKEKVRRWCGEYFGILLWSMLLFMMGFGSGVLYTLIRHQSLINDVLEQVK